MAGVTVADPSIYNNVWRPDPMSGVDLQGKYQDILQKRQQNQLTQQEIGLRQGLSDAAQASTNPDGTQDTGKFNTIIAHDPRTAWKAQEIFQGGNALNAPTSYTGTDATGNPIPKAVPAQFFRTLPGSPGGHPNQLMPSRAMPNGLSPAPAPQQTAPTITGQAAQDVHDKVDSLQGAATELANNPNPTRPTAISTFSDLISKGHLTPQEAVQAMSDPKDPLPDDPKQIQSWAARHEQALGQKKQILNKIAPLPMVDPNNPMAKITSTSGTLPTGEIFAEGMKPVQNLDDVLANPQLVEKHSNPAVQTQITPVAQNGAVAQPNLESPGVSMGVPVTQPEAIKIYNSTVEGAQNARQQAVIDQKIIDLANSGAPTGTYLKEVYQELAKAGLTNGKDTDPAVQLAEIKKYMGQRIQAQGGTSGTNDQLHALEGASPNDTQLPQVIKNLSQFNKASTLMNVAKADALQKSGISPNDYNKNLEFEQNWRQVADPRVIQYSMMDPKEKSSYVKTLDPKDAHAMLQKLRTLKQMHALDNLQ